MKKIYIALSFVLTIATSNAQNKDTKTADKLFDRYEYVDAAKEYLKIALEKADSYVYKQLGDCYYNVFNSVEAEKWYSKAVEKEQDAETYFRYAQMLKANTKYDLANVQMKKFATLSPNDNRTKFITVDENYITKLLGSTKLFDVKAAGFNTKYSEFGAYLKDNSLYFASARNTDRKTYDWNDQPFLDIYKIDYNEGAIAKEAVAVDDLNTKHHEGPVTISPDGNTIYFSRESFFEKEFEKVKTNNKKVGKMYIYKATKDGDKWANITSLEINNSKYNNSSPSLSKDGNTLYFSSDMPGGIGKSDVWKMTIAADGKLGKPENLGKTINTEGSEMFPFIADDETLYFSSNGRNGLGGLDVYSYNIKKNAEPINIGKPVNSEKDDFGFTFNQAKNIAFLSSNRNGGAGDDDIYIATPLCIVDLTVVVRDKKTTATISDAKITVVDQNKALLGTGISNQLGKALFQAECDKPYFLNVEKEGYVSQVFELANSKGEVTLTADLEPTVAIVAEKEIILSDVNFEYNKSNITQEGAFELNKLVEVLNQNPEMVILCKSHTDSRGNDKYNMSLSNRRAKSTVQYLISKGIAVERISGEGFGESEPKVPCGKDCTEEDHAKNRRSEFIIVKK
jgi:outer membrane protein OmpA-like peptidoglycan-associated protein/tetratricopeptide (TPR) repeat protein